MDIYHVLNTIKADQLDFGTWLNIFGYVRSESQEDEQGYRPIKNRHIYVQAIMVSDAGAIHVAEYEQSLSDMQAIDRRLRQDLP